MTLRAHRRRAIEIAVGIVTGIVVVLLVLIGLGVLVVPTSGATDLTVTGIQWTIHQGTTSFGFGWFGPNTINMTSADGLPLSVPVGGTFTVSLVLSNMDTTNHTVTSVSAAGGFHIARTSPGLPTVVASGSDDWRLTVTVGVPSATSSGDYAVELALFTS